MFHPLNPVLVFLLVSVLFPVTDSVAHQAGIQGGGAGSLGLKVKSIRLTAAGYMVDFRYAVTDPAKARQLINHHIKPYLIDEASGARMIVPAPPKLGAMRNTGNDLKVGPTYFIIFANPGRFIKKGNKVTVALGDVHIEHLVVQ